jgi:uncharacterized protein (TIGR03437 family)
VRNLRFKLFTLFFLALSATAFGQTPTVTGVLNGADFSTHLSPGLLVGIYGSNFGSGPASGVTVSVGGKAAYIAGVTPTQINAQLPFDATTGTAISLTVTVGGATSAPFSVTLGSYAPAFYTADGLGSAGSGVGLIRTAAGAAITSAAPAKPGDTVTAYAAGLGQTNPASATGSTAANPLATKPTLTVGGATANLLYYGTSSIPGLYQINFTVPAGLQGTVPVTISIGGQTSGSVTLALFGISAVVNNASFTAGTTAAPGSIVSVFANGLGTTNQTVGFPATAFQGISVSFNGTDAPLFHLNASAGTIDLLVPQELPASGTVNVQLITPAATSPDFTLTMVPAEPGMYYIADPSTKNRFNILAQFNATLWLAMPASMAAALNIAACTSNSTPLTVCAQPATAGAYLVLYSTGLGEATPNGDPNGTPLKTGAVAPADGSVLYKSVVTPTVTVGGLPANVLFSGIVPGYAGLYQIDFQVPAGVTGDDVPVVLSVGNSQSDTRTVAIH